jgi:hypothetical protein
MIVRLDRPRGTRRSSKKKSSSREQHSSLRGFLNLMELSSVTYIWVPASVNTTTTKTLRMRAPSANIHLKVELCWMYDFNRCV